MSVDLAIEKIMHWLHGGESTVVIAAAILLAVSFLIFILRAYMWFFLNNDWAHYCPVKS